jgi:hypothetical protein
MGAVLDLTELDGMTYLMAAITLMLTLADHWTTYLCLRTPIEGWHVTEANPVADWLFQLAGLVPGLAIDTAITGVALVFLIGTRRLTGFAKNACFALVATTTGYAVINNLGALREMGLSPLGLGS